MIITPQNRETVLQTFRENLAGLSISELSLKSGLNRNKCSQICSDYHKSEILGLIQKSTYKIYFLKHESVIHHIIDSITGPVLAVSRSFTIIGANQEYLTRYKTDPAVILGAPGEDLMNSICPELIPTLKLHLEDGLSGRTATYPDETGTAYWRTLTLSLNEDLVGLIILNEKSLQTRPADELIRTIENRFTAALPGLMAEKTWPQALDQIAGLLHESIPDSLIFTLLINEPAKTCTIHTIATPEGALQPVTDKAQIQLSGIEILQFKTSEPVTYFTGTQESLLNTPLPEPVKHLCQDLKVSSISMYGVSSDGHLTSVIGVGAGESSVSVTHVRLLHALSGYLTLLCTVCLNSSDMQTIKEDYQKHYSDIYALLTEKTEENAAHTTEAEHLKSILGAVLHTMNVSLIAVNRQGALITANKTACTAYYITDQNLADHASIRDILPPDLAAALLDLIPEKTEMSHNQTDNARYTEERQSGDIHWHRIAWNATHPAAPYLFIGEKHPAPLLKSLRSQKL
ncbi:MAG TPA: hypothetical protein VN429_09160 [Methanospirillum sp.]|uniref:hypothetical protein n=1 Tax=Methanospirillum sp. TaxID=45200 RepID=UPI002C635540|nr:hypothetical protein [Methanospirillum sp.]HWQ64570.1 hypothetical protein [Methanospirillum sp.]